MKHTITTSIALLAAIALACDTQAFWGGRGSYGSYGSAGGYGGYASAGSYGGYGSSGSYGGYGSSGSYGSSRHHASYGSAGSYGSSGARGGLLSRIFSRLHAHRGQRGHGSSGSYGSAGTYAVSYGSSGGYGSAGGYGSSGSYGGYGGGHVIEGGYESYDSGQGVPSDAPPAPPAPPADDAPPANPDMASAAVSSGLVQVEVPADAIVYVNGKLTTSTGTHRQYVSHGLRGDRSYSYDIRVEYEKDGKTVTESKHVTLTAGSNEKLAFATQPAADTVAARTKLQLRVPADARVTLAGVATRQKGEQREFVTTKLTPGQQWANYKVVVELDADGQTLTQEKTITLRGGESQELAFDFADAGTTLALRD